MILYCANINFYHEISNAMNLTPYSPFSKVWIKQQSVFLHQISYAVHSSPNFSALKTTRRRQDLSAFFWLVQWFGETEGITGKGKTNEDRQSVVIKENMKIITDLRRMKIRESAKPQTTWISVIPQFGPFCAKSSSGKPTSPSKSTA